MKIVIPVADENLNPFENGGHAPLFAILKKSGSGIWSGVRLIEFRNNPKANPDSPERCNHSEDDDCGNNHEHHHDENHIDKHSLLADSVADCDMFIAQWACGKTRAALRKKGIAFHLMSENIPEVKLVQDFLKRNSSRFAQTG